MLKGTGQCHAHSEIRWRTSPGGQMSNRLLVQKSCTEAASPIARGGIQEKHRTACRRRPRPLLLLYA